MKQLARVIAGVAVLVATVIAAPSPGLASSARVSGDPTLTGPVTHAIIAAPHPYIRKACRGELFVSWHRWTRVGSHRVLVAQVGCKYGTSGSPQDTGVFTKHGYERYLLDRGRPFTRGSFWITTANFGVPRPGVAVIRYDGYGPKDAMCCPSRFYARTYTLGWSRADAGALRRIKGSRD